MQFIKKITSDNKLNFYVAKSSISHQSANISFTLEKIAQSVHQSLSSCFSRDNITVIIDCFLFNFMLFSFELYLLPHFFPFVFLFFVTLKHHRILIIAVAKLIVKHAAAAIKKIKKSNFLFHFCLVK